MLLPPGRNSHNHVNESDDSHNARASAVVGVGAPSGQIISVGGVSGEGHVVGEPVSHCSHATPGHLNIPSSPQRLVSLARRIQYPSACSATVHNTMQDGGSNIIPTFDALSIEQVVARASH